jgi:hypothetical protein
VAIATAAGTYTVTVTGAAGSGTRAASYALTVTAPVSGGITNGGLETGTFTGWARVGTTSTNR